MHGIVKPVLLPVGRRHIDYLAFCFAARLDEPIELHWVLTRCTRAGAEVFQNHTSRDCFEALTDIRCTFCCVERRVRGSCLAQVWV